MWMKLKEISDCKLKISLCVQHQELGGIHLMRAELTDVSTLIIFAGVVHEAASPQEEAAAGSAGAPLTGRR